MCAGKGSKSGTEWQWNGWCSDGVVLADDVAWAGDAQERYPAVAAKLGGAGRAAGLGPLEGLA
jgi:hypothetical protein